MGKNHITYSEKKVNFCLCLIKHYASKMRGEMKVQLHAVLNLAARRGAQSSSGPRYDGCNSE